MRIRKQVHSKGPVLAKGVGVLDAGLALEWPRESDAGPKESQVAQPGRRPPGRGVGLLMATALRAAGGQVQSHMDQPVDQFDPLALIGPVTDIVPGTSAVRR